jgi:hypothetical protein
MYWTVPCWQILSVIYFKIYIIPNMLEIFDQLPDSYLAFAGRLSEITARAMAYGIEGAGRMRYTFFAHAQ